MNDAGSTLVDQKAANNLLLTGTYTGRQRGLLSTHVDDAVLFNGGRGFGGPAGGLNGAAASWELWVQPAALDGTFRQLCGFSTTDGLTDDFVLAVSNGFFQASLNGNPLSSLGVTPTVGTAYHVVVVCDNTNATVYVNGIATNTGARTFFHAYSAPNLMIGGTGSIYAAAFNGIIDEVAVYQTALSQTQVTNHFLAGVSAMLQGFQRNANTLALSTTTNASVGNQVGFNRDVAGNLVVTLSGPGTMQLGFMRDASGNLVTVPYASAVGPISVKTGFLRDANNALVMVTTALAAAPVAMKTGFLRDLNNALVTQ